MKRLFILVLALGIVFASEHIPFNRIQEVADNFINQHFGQYTLSEQLTYYGIDETPGAYALIYRDINNQPLTIVMGAKYNTTPINEVSQALPQYLNAYERILAKARSLTNGEPEFLRVYYFGPGAEFCDFNIDGKEILINAYNFYAIDKAEFFNNAPEPNRLLEDLTREKWNKYLTMTNFATRQDTGYVPNVPFIDWTYGCSPTSASMIFWFWDQYAPNPNYGRLVDYFFTRYELLYGYYKDQANVNRELALAMYTDSTTGGTTISMIRYGMETCANSYNGYSCTVTLSGQGSSSNQYYFSWIRDEIDNGRPCHWNLLYYYYGGDFINHSVVGVGYWIEPPDTFVRVHNTWGWSGEPLWDLWTYHSPYYSIDYVIRFIPGGGVTDNIFLDFPKGGFVFKNLKYKIRWTSVGSNIDHVKMWWSIGTQAQSYDSTNWTLITSNAPNTGEYIWTAPDQDSALRVNIAGLSSSNQRLAADGNLDKTQCVFPNSTTNLTLVGHFGDAADARDIVVVNDYAYICNGANGLYVADISDSSLPDLVNHLSLPGNNIAMARSGSYLYLADQEDTLRVISISDPANPSQVAKLALSVDQPRGICVSGNYAYVACRGSGIVIVDISTPTAPNQAGTYDTPGQAYDVMVVDTLAYVADGTRGLRVLNVSNPSSVSEIGFLDTNGISQGIDINSTTLYLAEGGQGVKVIDINNPVSPQQLGSFDTPGTAQNVVYSDSLFVCDGGNGLLVLDVSSPSNPVEVESMETFGTAAALVHSGTMVYLADVADGLYLIHEDLEPGVKERNERALIPALMISSPQTKTVHFALALNTEQNITVNVYDATGRLVKTSSQSLKPGVHNFSVKPLTAGVYFVRVNNEQGAVTRKVVFIK